MAEFLYKAKDSIGADHTGSVQSTDEHAAAVVLRKKGLIVISINAKEGGTNSFFKKFFDRVSFTELVIITRQLATMVSAGLVLSEAIDILEEQQIGRAHV